MIYDGECGSCTLMLHTHKKVSGAEDVALKAAGVQRPDCEAQVQLLSGGVVIAAGADAFNIVFKNRYWLQSVFRFVECRPALMRLEREAYFWVARHRVRISTFLGTARFATLKNRSRL